MSASLGLADLTTAYLAVECSAIAMQSALEILPGLGNVKVTKRALPLCSADGSGCGVNFEHGYGSTYQIVFLSLRSAEPSVSVVSIRYPGQSLDDSVSTYQSTSNADDLPAFTILTTSLLVRTGRSVYQTKTAYAQSSTSTSSTNSGNSSSQTAGQDLEIQNPWLTPAWLMIFDRNTTPPSGLDDSLSACKYKVRFTTIDQVRTFILPTSMWATHVKIQREDLGALSVAEFEIYQPRLNLLEDYVWGSPVIAEQALLPFQSHTPLTSAFELLPFSGRWLCRLVSSTNVSLPADGNNLIGSLSDVVLVLTDYAGVVQTYYMEVIASVTTLPRYGTLFATTLGSLKQFNSFPDSLLPYINLSPLQQQQLTDAEATSSIYQADDGRGLYLGLCYASDTHNSFSNQNRAGKVSNSDDMVGMCWQTFDRPPQLSAGLHGAVPATRFVRGSRILVYLPQPGFHGDDAFSYTIYAPLGPQLIIQNVTVELSVKKCEQWAFVDQTISSSNANETDVAVLIQSLPQAARSMCACRSIAYDVVGGWSSDVCEAGRQSICSNPLLASHWADLCWACYPATSILTSSSLTNSTDSDACRRWTLRISMALTMKGACKDSERWDNQLYAQAYPAANFSANSAAGAVCVKSRGITPLPLDLLRGGQTQKMMENVGTLNERLPRRSLPHQTRSRRSGASSRSISFIDD
eukprot:scaffold967_cov173-Ochromonas_danica.AAC.29